MFEKILTPLDGSELAEIVLPYVMELSNRLGSQVSLLHVCSPGEAHYCHVNEIYLEHVETSLAEQTKKAGRKPPRIFKQVVVGSTVEEILEYAEANKVSLIAMSTHGRAGLGRWVLGSVADKLVRVSDFPILFVRSKVPERVPAEKWPAKGILVPLDGSETGEAVLPYVEELAKTLARPVVLQQVITDEYRTGASIDGSSYLLDDKTIKASRGRAGEYLTKVAGRLKDKGIQSEVEISVGAPAGKIVECANSCGVDLIAMTSYGSSGIARFVTGSVAQRVLHEAETPILMVRPK